MEVTRASTLQVSAAFGAKEDELSRYFVNGIIDYGEPLRDLRSTLRRLVDQATSQRDRPPPPPLAPRRVSEFHRAPLRNRCARRTARRC